MFYKQAIKFPRTETELLLKKKIFFMCYPLDPAQRYFWVNNKDIWFRFNVLNTFLSHSPLHNFFVSINPTDYL